MRELFVFGSDKEKDRAWEAAFSVRKTKNEALARERRLQKTCANCNHHYDGEQRPCCIWSMVHRQAGDKWVFQGTDCDETIWSPRKPMYRRIIDLVLRQ